VAGTFASKPKGIILHGSRSGQDWSVAREFDSCRNYAASGAGGLGWNATVGQLIDGTSAYSVHMSARQWGWSARHHSNDYLAVEFAQAQLSDAITDAQVQAFAAWYRAEVVPVWGALDLSGPDALPMHSELAAGQADGKTDAFLKFSGQANDLRRRIRAAL
jgi:hypothetical protein